MVFLAFDVFFMIFCIAVAFIAFFTLFCCFPILATVAYAMTIGEGASLSDIRTLPKYRYCQPPNAGGSLRDYEKQETNLIAVSESSNIPTLTLDPEDSVSIHCLFGLLHLIVLQLCVHYTAKFNSLFLLMS